MSLTTVGGTAALASDPLADAIDLLEQAGYTFEISGAAQVYVNRDLRMSKIQWIGFDMDYTLALYRQRALDALSVRHTVDTLVDQHGYPETIREIVPDPDFAIRGLVIDKVRGNILKMDSHHYVGRVFHGLREAPPEVKRSYQKEQVKIESARFLLVDTLFGLPEAYIYAAVIDRLEADRSDELDFSQIYDDVRAAIDLAHADGRLKRDILADLPAYIRRDPDLPVTLHKFRSAGKRLFLLTNSECYYSERVMSFLLDGQLGSYPTWRNYFDVIVTTAKKPSFFRGSEPFVRLGPSGEIASEEVEQFERGEIYEGGNVNQFETLLGLHGDAILYVGDHIYGDIVRSKRDSAWRTAMIIQEMDAELRKRQCMVDDIERTMALDLKLASLNSDLSAHRRALSRLQDVYGDEEPTGDTPLREKVDRARTSLVAAIQKLSRLRREVLKTVLTSDDHLSEHFNPYWGLLFKEGAEHSIFAAQVEEYACLYTSRVGNFRRYSPMQYFRARRQVMPHEM